MSLGLLPIMYFKTGSDLSQITHFEVNYPDDFVKQAGTARNKSLHSLVATKKGAVREIKGRHGRTYQHTRQ